MNFFYLFILGKKIIFHVAARHLFFPLTVLSPVSPSMSPSALLPLSSKWTGAGFLSKICKYVSFELMATFVHRFLLGNGFHWRFHCIFLSMTQPSPFLRLFHIQVGKSNVFFEKQLFGYHKPPVNLSYTISPKSFQAQNL